MYLAYTKFVNTMNQKPMVEQLAAPGPRCRSRVAGRGWDYLYEPDAPTVIDDLLVRYVESLVYQAVAENMACEQAARMVAMKAATDNAGNVINDLQLVYNKTRQAAITKELSEIVAVPPRFEAANSTNLEERNKWPSQGKIVQFIGAVVDVEFPRDQIAEGVRRVEAG